MNIIISSSSSSSSSSTTTMDFGQDDWLHLLCQRRGATSAGPPYGPHPYYYYY